MPGGHQSTLPEVTFLRIRLVSAAGLDQHGGMDALALHPRLDRLLQPLNLIGLLTLLAVAATLGRLAPAQAWLAYPLIVLFAVLMLLDDVAPVLPAWVRDASLVAMGAIALFMLATFPQRGTLVILTVVWAAIIAGEWPARRVLIALIVANAIIWWMLREAGASSPTASVLLVACFQLFAAMTMHYARRAEDARDHLARVNADLLATRALLADSSRDAERLRVARELHDVAGHKLTALRHNLRALNAGGGASPQLQLAEQLSAELLADIRGVVHALRDVEGLDIAAALQALAAPFPQPRLELTMDDGVHITDPALADTVLRVVQEALTNSARHSEAKTLKVALATAGDALHLRIEDDGRLPGAWREGHGLTGMRERIEERGGRIDFARGARGGLRIEAELPA